MVVSTWCFIFLYNWLMSSSVNDESNVDGVGLAVGAVGVVGLAAAVYAIGMG